MKAPDFWYPTTIKLSSWQSLLLAPFSWLYLLGYKLRVKFSKPYKASIPVICIGNAVAGGGGKTPTALYVQSLFKNSAILSRGYGGNFKGPIFVDTNTHQASQTGDEALLLAKTSKVIVAKDKEQGARFASKQGINYLILDDGYQNPTLHKDVNILVVDERGFGNNRLIPSGPLREPIETALAKADIILQKGDAKIITDKPIFKTSYEASATKTEGKYVAFSGIANPQRFKQTLDELNIECVEFIPFADHHFFSDKEWRELTSKSDKLITTEKDFARLSPKQQKQVEVVSIKLKIEKEDEFKSLLLGKLK